MSVLVDTPLWSLSFRRRAHDLSEPEHSLVGELSGLIIRNEALLLGVVRQEVLSGVRGDAVFDELRKRLGVLRDLPVWATDHEAAARCYNRCRAAGVTGAVVDMLICAVALRLDLPIFTTDMDFHRYAKHLPIRLHVPHGA